MTKSASINTYNSIKQAIIDRTILPGTALVEEELAEQFEVSRTPVREALKWLENDGLVIYYPYRGSFVRTFSENDVNEIYTVRMALEGTCAAISAEVISDETVAMLESNQAMSVKEFKAGNLEASEEYGNIIHSVLLDTSGNQLIRKLWLQIRAEQEYFNNIAKKMNFRMEKSISEHQRIIDALKVHDPEAAESAAKAHIKSTMEDMIVALRNARI